MRTSDFLLVLAPLALLAGCAPSNATPAAGPAAGETPDGGGHVVDFARPPPPPSPAEASILTFTPGTAIAFAGGWSVVVTDIVAESIAPSPSDPRAYPAGSGITANVTVRGERLQLTRLSSGYRSRAVGWSNDVRLELVDGDDKKVRIGVEQLTDRLADATRIRVRRGGSERVFGKETLLFSGHSHKDVGPGEESPLMVSYAIDGEADTRNVDMRTSKAWAWHDFRFTIENYAYDDWMELVVQRMALEPAPRSRSAP